MNQRPLFDIIKNQDFSQKELERQKQKILTSDRLYEEKKKEVINDLEALFKITQCKYQLSNLLENENIFNIVRFLEKSYYNQEELLRMTNNVLRFMFVPLYYKDDENYAPQIPQEFWSTPLGKIIISCLSANDDILLSSTEAGLILNYKRQNMSVLANEGKIPYKRVGGNLVFRLLDVLTYKEKMRKRQEEN